MYRIEKKEYGFKLTFEGVITADEMRAWLIESKQMLVTAPETFFVFVDMRTLKPLNDDAQVFIKQGQKIYRQTGMIRSAVIVDNVITALQFRRIASETNIYDGERYIDSSSVFNWKQIGLDWILKGIEPDSLQQFIDKYEQRSREWKISQWGLGRQTGQV